MFLNTNNCPIIVPDASLGAYKVANYWSTYADRIQAVHPGRVVLYTSTTSSDINTYNLGGFGNDVSIVSKTYASGIGTLVCDNDITTFGNVFANVEELASIVIPGTVTTIGTEAFSNCTGLQDITLPESLTTIGNYAFNRCTGLTSLIIPKNVTDIGKYGLNCPNMTSLTLLRSTEPVYGDQYALGSSTNDNLVIYVPSHLVDLYKDDYDYGFWDNYRNHFQAIPE